MRYKVKEDNLLIEQLSLIFPKMSNNKIRKMLTNNRIELDGLVVNKAKKAISNLKIVYSDEDFFSVNL